MNTKFKDILIRVIIFKVRVWIVDIRGGGEAGTEADLKLGKTLKRV